MKKKNNKQEMRCKIYQPFQFFNLLPWFRKLSIYGVLVYNQKFSKRFFLTKIHNLDS